MSDEQRSMVHFQAKPEGLAARQRGFELIEDTPYRNAEPEQPQTVRVRY
ncbi:MAG: hypothetical protein HQL50_01695 [Magnetococcales bacterium]|nr:hypothetical protein [Magnetococcales bacterium]